MRFADTALRIPAVLLLTLLCLPSSAGVVTVITHGFNSDTEGWVKALGNAIGAYPRRLRLHEGEPSIYRVKFNAQGRPQGVRISGPAYAQNPSGDIVVLLDWNPYSGTIFGSGESSTTNIGPVLGNNFFLSDFIPELGIPIARFPLHLIGHSRGGSLVCEIAKKLGERGVVVDHMTLLDPHPVNNDGFAGDLTDQFVDAVDGTARKGVYENVLFSESVYQNRGSFPIPNGTFVEGAFVRYLNEELSGSDGYTATHSDIHLWYHATTQFLAPLTTDGEASLSIAGRDRWYSPAEDEGRRAGYFYSLRGGGNRRSSPAVPNKYSGPPWEGLNGKWTTALGITSGGVRTAVTRSSTKMANIVEMNLEGAALADDTVASLGGPIRTIVFGMGANRVLLKVLYWSDFTDPVRLTVLLDKDENSSNGFESAQDFWLPATKGAVVSTVLDLTDLAAQQSPWMLRVGAITKATTFEREMYAPEKFFVVPDIRLENVPGTTPALRITGMRNLPIEVEASADLQTWGSIGQVTLSEPTANVIVASALVPGLDLSASELRFVRARTR
jgi:pimeloyl-ACP methyl ester carboxylesterase